MKSTYNKLLMLGDQPPHHSKAQRVLTLAVGVALIACLGWMRTEKAKALEIDPRERLVHPYRLRIKLGEDELAGSVNRVASETTLGGLMALPLPKSVPVGRIVPLETQVWRVRVHVRGVLIQPDGDLVLQVQDGAVHTTAEIPEPEFCPESPFHASIEATRRKLLQELNPDATLKAVDRQAEICGVGFAGLPDRYSRKGVCIYPATSVKWLRATGNAR